MTQNGPKFTKIGTENDKKRSQIQHHLDKSLRNKTNSFLPLGLPSAVAVLAAGIGYIYATALQRRGVLQFPL